LFEGYEWSYDGVYAYGIEGYDVSSLIGSADGWEYEAFDDEQGWYGWIYAESYDYVYAAWAIE